MERPPQHVTDSLGKSLLRGVFEPFGWVVREISQDYGLDFEVEIFHGGKSTGGVFKVQLKSSERTPYSAGGDFISQQLQGRNAAYLCKEVRLPVILVHADVSAKRVFWEAPQLSVDVIQKLLMNDPGSTITVRIPTSQALPASINSLLETIRTVETLLASRVVMAAPIPDFLALIEGQVDKDKLSQELKNKSDALKLDQVRYLFNARRYGEARIRVEKIINDLDASVESRFAAWNFLEKIEWLEIARTGVSQSDLPQLRLAVSLQLQRLTKNGLPYLKFYALIVRKAAELDALVHQDLGLLMNWRAHEESGDIWWRIQLGFERAALRRHIAAKYNQCIRLARYASNSKYRWALPQALVRIVEASYVFIGSLRLEGSNEAARYYSDTALQVCRLAAWIASNSDNQEEVVLSALTAFPIAKDEDDEPVRWARETIASIPEKEIRENGEARLDRNLRRIRGEKLEGDIRTTPRQIYENMAAALGIDLSDPRDPIADVVRIGIEDLDPSRILKNCEHIFISLGPRGLPAQLLQLPTAGIKIIHCVLHKHAIQGLSLDPAYSAFKKQFCDKCPDSSPRPETWKYSDEWQQRENARRAEYMRVSNEKRS